MQVYQFIVGEEEEDMRLDVYLSNQLPDISRNYIQKIILKEKIKVDGKIETSKKYRLKQNNRVEIEIPAAEPLKVEPENIPIDIVYEDDDLIVVNKPQGMVVHPAVGNYHGTLVNALLYHCKNLSSINGIIRPGIVHRIDKDTSGLLVVAKNDKAHHHLAEQLKAHTMLRIYTALVYGNLKEDEGIISAPIGRHPTDRLKMAVVKGKGKDAVTHFRVLKRFGDYTLVEAKLETGRTHQIRVHFSFIQRPLVGDLVYGPKKQKFHLAGQALHARTLGFVHPTEGKFLKFEADLPDYFKKLLQQLENKHGQ